MDWITDRNPTRKELEKVNPRWCEARFLIYAYGQIGIDKFVISKLDSGKWSLTGYWARHHEVEAWMYLPGPPD